MMIKINQLTPALHKNDAVGESIQQIQQTTKSWGCESNVFSPTIDEPLKEICRQMKDFAEFDSEDSINILHFAVPSPLTDLFKKSKGKKILIYHNITPPEFFKGVNEEMVHIASVGRQELAALAECNNLALGDSEFNENELKEMGYKYTGVFPILLNPERYKYNTLAPLEEMFCSKDHINLLFVGRITPNKKIEDVIKVFYYFKNIFCQDSRLIIVGNPAKFENYDKFLKDFVNKLELLDVYFTGKVDQQELVTYYSLSDVFITMSEHEGFCVPILESFFFKLPVVAFNSTAIPYTMGDGGILVNKKSYRKIAGIINELNNNKKLHDSIIKNQKKQLHKFSPEKIKKTLKQILTGNDWKISI